MRLVRLIGRAAVAALVLVGGSTSAFAQSNDEVFPQFQFNFSTPGARANAMGRTFIGIADDASVTITNPAGLSLLTRRQFYFEFKATDLEVDRLAEKRSLFTLQSQTFGETTSSVSFLSLSVPINERFAVAFTRHEFLNYQENFHLDPRPIPESASTFFAVNGETDFKAASYAGSVSVNVNPKFRVGLTLSLDKLSASSVATRFRHTFGNPSDAFDVTETSLVQNQTEIDGDDSGLSAVIGALIEPTDQLRIGVQFAKGASFEVDESLLTNPSPTGNATLEVASGFPKPVKINVPDRFGVGVSYRPTARLLAAVDISRIGYSSLAKDFTVIFSPDFLSAGNFEIDDVVEVHAGAEYLLVPGERRLFVRAGLYSSPDHSTRFLPGSDPDTNASQVSKYNLLPRETDVIGTFGAGAAVGTRFQADFAYAVGREFVASIAVRF